MIWRKWVVLIVILGACLCVVSLGRSNHFSPVTRSELEAICTHLYVGAGVYCPDMDCHSAGYRCGSVWDVNCLPGDGGALVCPNDPAVSQCGDQTMAKTCGTPDVNENDCKVLDSHDCTGRIVAWGECFWIPDSSSWQCRPTLDSLACTGVTEVPQCRNAYW